ncbi:response regulator transcription factor [Spirosoma sp. BT702]|uniref:Response regulator transcription factor n=1 Tax=Spirosoma profusum TaxID=2771354 RepID=A0A927AW57_9BACT|nr:LytTR family DNA-binding domain-containing protein [Spirosoma profusum]MBD2705481.1 response regulator transcription factor [Spirosoma profusum]
MTYTALIADDEVVARQLIRTLLKDNDTIHVVGEAVHGVEAVTQILKLKPDIVFLDIQMPEMDGFDAIREIWPHHQPAIIFTTAYDQYAIKAFEVNAIDYLLKPFDEIRFQQAVERAIRQLTTQLKPDMSSLMTEFRLGRIDQKEDYLKRILVKEHHKLTFVKLVDVLYLEAEGNYVNLCTQQRKFTIYNTMNLLDQKLDPADFTRISRSHIINLNYVEELEAYFNGEFHVKMVNGKILKWTRSYREGVKTFLGRE